MPEVILLLRRLKARRRRKVRRQYAANRIYRVRHSFLELTEEQVLHQYHLDKQTVHNLCEQLSTDLCSVTNRSHALPAVVKITSALCFLATGSFQTSTGDSTGISQSAMSNSLTQFLDALVKRTCQYIYFPNTSQKQQQTKREFCDIDGFPDVLGAIGCTHVAIRAPSENETVFRNRKNIHSLNMQVVCDAKCRITDVVAKYPGSCQDSYILTQSAIYRLFETGWISGGWLLGNSGYPLKAWLMTPVAFPNIVVEVKYNNSHSKTYSVTERTFDLLKMRFQCLDHSGGALQYSPHKVCQIFLACCILHNIAVARGIPLIEHESQSSESTDDDYDDDGGDENIDAQSQTPSNKASDKGIETRAHVIKTYFS
uniref:Putative nuclease HARBI1 n=1 Tax=Latimeria chalumnae TaxID=7897 RepID=M3XKF0_LATCH|nr:PREDICTED: putative nuclease HARBI1 [Latimeria chalumnae]|eukprot:XP_006011388.1 PREDICTED: putative nuclease HARBI1 [Latimeria chalumnae]